MLPNEISIGSCILYSQKERRNLHNINEERYMNIQLYKRLNYDIHGRLSSPRIDCIVFFFFFFLIYKI